MIQILVALFWSSLVFGHGHLDAINGDGKCVWSSGGANWPLDKAGENYAYAQYMIHGPENNVKKDDFAPCAVQAGSRIKWSETFLGNGDSDHYGAMHIIISSDEQTDEATRVWYKIASYKWDNELVRRRGDQAGQAMNEHDLYIPECFPDGQYSLNMLAYEYHYYDQIQVAVTRATITLSGQTGELPANSLPMLGTDWSMEYKTSGNGGNNIWSQGGGEDARNPLLLGQPIVKCDGALALGIVEANIGDGRLLKDSQGSFGPATNPNKVEDLELFQVSYDPMVAPGWDKSQEADKKARYDAVAAQWDQYADLKPAPIGQANTTTTANQGQTAANQTFASPDVNDTTQGLSAPENEQGGNNDQNNTSKGLPQSDVKGVSEDKAGYLNRDAKGNEATNDVNEDGCKIVYV